MGGGRTVRGRSVFSGRPLAVSVRGGRISAVDLEAETGQELPTLAPAFIDLQVNGYRGLDYSSPDLEAEHIHRLVRMLAVHGTGCHFPTIVTSPSDLITHNLALIAEAVKRDPLLEHAVPGVHVEGPFISPQEGPRGAHDPRFVRDPDVQEIRDWHAAAGGLLKIITLAPERPGATQVIEEAVELGIRVAVGHTAAEAHHLRAAVDAGATLSTHLGNGSAALLPRLRNPIWEQLAADELAAGVICDGFHLPGPVLKVFHRVKGGDRLFLVSDVAVMGGMEPGRHRWGNIEVEVHPDGHLGLAGTPYLAGAGHLLDRCVVGFTRAAGCGLGEAIRLCTEAPARLMNMADVRGRLAQGALADLLLFQPSTPALRVVETIVVGETLYSA
jgi:N-acetylglucosamine-6-phosphate deacetylase